MRTINDGTISEKLHKCGRHTLTLEVNFVQLVHTYSIIQKRHKIYRLKYSRKDREKTERVREAKKKGSVSYFLKGN